MGSHDPFGHLKHKLWPKEGSGVELAIWILTIKSWESTRFPFVQVACHIPLETSQWGLQLCFRLHLNRRFVDKVMGPQSCRSLGTKCHLDVGLVERHRVYYNGEGGAFPQVWAVVNLVNPSSPWFVLAPKMLQLCANHFVLVFCRFVWVVDACHFS
jgi:hypothetical protein